MRLWSFCCHGAAACLLVLFWMMRYNQNCEYCGTALPQLLFCHLISLLELLPDRLYASLYIWMTAVDKHWRTTPVAAALTLLLMFTRGTSRKRKLHGSQISSSCQRSLLSKECRSWCLPTCCYRESPQFAVELTNHSSLCCSVYLNVFLSHREYATLLMWTACVVYQFAFGM